MEKLLSLCRVFKICVLIVLLNLNGINCVEYLTKQPPYLPPCKIYEPGFTNCSTHSVQQLMEEVVKGIPEITEAFGSVDPIMLDKVVFEQDNNDVANIRANLTDLKIKGFSKMKVKESRVSKKDFSWETKVFIPSLRIDADYVMVGKILVISLKGAGKMFIEIENCDILMHTKTLLYEKGGFTFYNVTQVRVDLAMTRVKTNFENIFNGNSKEVEKSTNDFFNENWREFFEALRPLIKDTVERVLLKLLQITFHFIPANFLVEDIPTSAQLYAKQ